MLHDHENRNAFSLVPINQESLKDVRLVQNVHTLCYNGQKKMKSSQYRRTGENEDHEDRHRQDAEDRYGF